MEIQEDAIVDIPKERLSFFGGEGKMLLPSAATRRGADRENGGGHTHHDQSALPETHPTV